MFEATIFFKLMIGHALADFVFQQDAMAMGKNRHNEIHKSRGAGFPPWQYWLVAHVLVHAGAVYFVTGSALLAVIEAALHAIIDFSKCERWINFHQDQFLHLVCKAAYLPFL